MDARTGSATGDFLAPVLDFALRRPGRTLFLVLAAHVLVWTALPLLTSGNLELDLAEDLALGKEWQLGYWKHPPLPWWLADLFYRLTGKIESVYLLGPLTVAACYVGVYLLARDMMGPSQALLAALSLVGIHYYNYSAVKFAHDQMQLPFWAFAALFYYRALTRDRAFDWILAGVLLAGAFWSKYAAFALAAAMALFLVVEPAARRKLAGIGPWLMAAAFAVVIAPNAWWLVDSGFLPLEYADTRARTAVRLYEYFKLPLKWSLTQAVFILPTLILLAVILFPRRQWPMAQPVGDAFARRYAAAMALGPFAVVTAITVFSGRAPVAMWGYPLWSLLPLAAILWFGPVTETLRLRAFAVGFAFLFLLGPAMFLGNYVASEYLRPRPKATQFPGRALAQEVTQLWRATTGTPLAYVAGTEFVANSIAVYSPDRPHVVVHGKLKLSPWVDSDDLRRRGVMVVWEDRLPAAKPQEWSGTFGTEGEPGRLEIARTSRRAKPPLRIRYWIVPPRN